MLLRTSATPRDYLDALDTWKRSVRLTIETEHVLRQGGSSLQKARQRELLTEARDQIHEQMRSAQRSAFRGEVSVDLSLFLPDSVPTPSAPKSVKRYIDALQGPVYRNDRQVAHLRVTRFARDHPVLGRSTGLRSSSLRGQEEVCKAHFTVTPLRLYVADFDRVFANRSKLDGRETFHLWIDSEPTPFFDEGWTDEDEEQLEELRQERRDDDAQRGLDSLDDPKLAATMREFRELRIRELESKLMLDQCPESDDRPGPAEQPMDTEWLRELGPPALSRRDRWELPGQFWLPIPPEQSGGPNWKTSVRAAMSEHRERWPILPDAFREPLALDIAIEGMRRNASDIDNVAHAVLSAFEELYCEDWRGTVVAYRAYRRVSADSTSGVRVQVMTASRLRDLDAAIEDARRLVFERGTDGEHDGW